MFLNNTITRSASSTTASLESSGNQSIDKPALVNRFLSFDESSSSSSTTTTTVRKRDTKRQTSNIEKTSNQQSNQLFEFIEDTLTDDNSNSSIECTQCSKLLASEFGLIRHFDMHHPTLSVLCSQCHIVFKSHRALKSHIHRNHSKTLHHHHSRHHDTPEQSSSRYNTRTMATTTTTSTSLSYLPNYSYISSYLVVAFSSKQFPIIAKLACEQERLPLGVLTSKLYQCIQCSRSFPCSRTLKYHSVTHHGHSKVPTCSDALEYIISQLEDENIQMSYEVLDTIIKIIETTEQKTKQEMMVKPQLHHSPLTTPTARTVMICSSTEITTTGGGGDDDSGFGSEYYLSPISDIVEFNLSVSATCQYLKSTSNIFNEQQQQQQDLLHSFSSQRYSTEQDMNDFDASSSLLSSYAYQFGLIDKRLSQKLTKIKLQQQRSIHPQCLHAAKTCANLCVSNLSSYNELIENYPFNSQITSIPKGSLGQIVPKLPAKRPPLLAISVPVLLSPSSPTSTTTITLSNEQSTAMKRKYQKQNRATDTQLVPVMSNSQFTQETEKKNSDIFPAEDKSIHLNGRINRNHSRSNVNKNSPKTKTEEQQETPKLLMKTPKKRRFDTIDTSVTTRKRFQTSQPSNSQSISKKPLFPKSMLSRNLSKEKLRSLSPSSVSSTSTRCSTIISSSSSTSVSKTSPTSVYKRHRRTRIPSPVMKTPISLTTKVQKSSRVRVEEKQKKTSKQKSIRANDEQENEDDDNEVLSTYQRNKRYASNGSNHSIEYVQTIELNNIENTRDVINTTDCAIIDLEKNERFEHPTSPETVNNGDDEIVICDSPSPKRKYSSTPSTFIKKNGLINNQNNSKINRQTVHNDEDDILFRCKVCADILYGRKNFANHVFNTHPTLLKQNLAKKQLTTTR
ncbi:unnamed protein product [Didymodactylos carnosus]|uniref:C2H2-type domain-containing protein n=1 Tax=Didymodactylos carnosus TaxID=1234261 RepID=A0A813NX62_9BILA|nr:unnamed protein product [Didymodactylos carnosus]CAF0745874.1 unnamed protein product [Didymodactylos carnosus]CAF3506091.1 unnamed protein product [Didymodactylos carnosus]CAF3524614.1 unnamed protein product [Didymodactylos carnosus]